MNLRTRARLIAAVSLIILQPLGHAQTKVFTPAELAQAQRDAAARAAAAAKKRAARAAAGQPVPVAPQPAAPAPAAAGAVYVTLTNHTPLTYRALVILPDGTPQVIGEVPPSAQSGGPIQLESLPGQEWRFIKADGTVVQTYIATRAAQQALSIGAPVAASQPAGSDVTIQVINQTGQTLTHQSRKPDGTVKNHSVGPTKSYTSQPGTQWVFSTPDGTVVRQYTVTAQKQQQLVIGTPGVAIARPPTSASQPGPPEESSGAETPEQDILCAYVNQERDRLRLRRVKWSSQLGAKAQQMANDIATSGVKNAKGQPPEVHFNRWPLSQGPADFVRYWTQNKEITEAPGALQLPNEQWVQADQEDIDRVQHSYRQMVAPQTRAVGFGAATNLAANAQGRVKVFVILFQ